MGSESAIARGVIRTLSTLLALGLAASACDYPRDIEGTRESVAERGIVKVGVAGIRHEDEATARRFLARIGEVARARVVTTPGTTDELLAMLEHGELDLVVGEFAEDSPWNADVALIEPLTTRVVGTRTLGLAPVARNGENAWIGLVEREVRDARAGR